jgi:hypothetical protein
MLSVMERNAKGCGNVSLDCPMISSFSYIAVREA